MKKALLVVALLSPALALAQVQGAADSRQLHLSAGIVCTSEEPAEELAKAFVEDGSGAVEKVFMRYVHDDICKLWEEVNITLTADLRHVKGESGEVIVYRILTPDGREGFVGIVSESEAPVFECVTQSWDAECA